MSWLLVFAGFSLLIILHEAGHMIAAKAVGMRVERFFLFFPPKLVSIKRGETEYGIGMIPLGGFVKITGMNPDEVHPPTDREPARPSRLTTVMEGDTAGGTDDFKPLPPDVVERAYYNQPVWKRIFVIGAGPAVNIAIAFFILFGLGLTAEKAVGPDLKVQEIEKGSPADGQLQVDDQILSVDGVAADNQGAYDRADVFRDQIGTHKCADDETTVGCVAATPVQLVVLRDGKKVPLSIAPKYDTAVDPPQPLLGVRFSAVNLTSADNSPADAADTAIDQMWFVGTRTVATIGKLFKSEERKQVSGVVGTSGALHEATVKDSRLALLVLALISLSLGIINLFPFLPLDGGHIFWSIVEKLRGRPVAFSVMEKASLVGFALVMMLFFIGLSNDIGRISDGQGFGIK